MIHFSRDGAFSVGVMVLASRIKRQHFTGTHRHTHVHTRTLTLTQLSINPDVCLGWYIFPLLISSESRYPVKRYNGELSQSKLQIGTISSELLVHWKRMIITLEEPQTIVTSAAPPVKFRAWQACGWKTLQEHSFQPPAYMCCWRYCLFDCQCAPSSLTPSLVWVNCSLLRSLSPMSASWGTHVVLLCNFSASHAGLYCSHLCVSHSTPVT